MSESLSIYRTTSRVASRTLKLNSLSLDNLLHIVDFLKPPDISNLTKTDRALRRSLVPTLLKGHVMVSWRRPESFRTFMDADSSRVSLLRRLELETGEASVASHVDSCAKSMRGESLRAFVLQTVRRCSNLVVLSMKLPAFGGLTPMVVRTTLGDLPQLEELRLMGVTQAYQDVLVGALPSLRSVELSFEYVSWSDLKTPWTSLDPFPFLRDHTSQIEQLTIKNALIHDNAESFPHVRVLDLAGVFVPDGIRTLVRLFPAVEELSTQFFCLGNLEKDRLYLLNPGYASVQALVRSARDKYMSLPLHERTWPHLRRVSTRNASELYYLGVLCPSGVLNMDFRAEILKQADWLSEVFDNLRPKEVSCHAYSLTMWHAFETSLEYIMKPLLHRSVSVARDVVLRSPQDLLQQHNLPSLVSLIVPALSSPDGSVIAPHQTHASRPAHAGPPGSRTRDLRP
ncbi:hypothetical protein OH76DRAFT_901028 [Lentinus brumalis]|uniref:F-box domain-containing protein n=1 Tax=Lentinus brumalis TaxID=2498619 RepID=A0A371D0V0_9APHY|nr:hypothetical protein OH76DRAFT_901028 [Polyporus brumalis]